MPPPRARAQPRPIPAAPAPGPRLRLRRVAAEPPAGGPLGAQTSALHVDFRRVTQSRTAATLRRTQNAASDTLLQAVSRRAQRIPAPLATRTSASALMSTTDVELARFSARLASQLHSMQEEAYRAALASAERMVSAVDRSEDSAAALRDRETVADLIEARSEAAAPEIEEIVASEIAEMRSGILRSVGETLAAGGTNQRLALEINKTFEAEFYRVTRAARTYLARIYNGALADAAGVLARADSGIYLRWTEHVNDFTGTPTDALTARDSIVMHGQVRKAGASFVMPQDVGVSPKLWNKTFDYPPNRPNDRAVVMPWRKSWGTPSYEIRSSGKVWIVRR